MEIFAFALGIAFLIARAERQHRKDVYPPGICMYCGDRVTFNWKSKPMEWVHSNGKGLAPFPLSPNVNHGAYPTHRSAGTARFLLDD